MRNFEGGSGGGANPTGDAIERDRQALRELHEKAGVLGGYSESRGNANVAEWVNDSLAGASAIDAAPKAFEVGEGDIERITARLVHLNTEIQRLTDEVNTILDRRSKVVDPTVQSQMRELVAKRMKEMDDYNFEKKQLEDKLTSAAPRGRAQ